ncbi:winged helix-turn-helix domain-containing protein [Enterococcus sp. HY326]|uniref:winged helix-turn-helix domain-containing protein n=1 Tax=Enterococcus sp. HY326 TaxID=2971265 RepID=UPI00223FF0CC|nr:winged helix-turn-helix domain-containing protein [Enterococcus sp. HY326]
MEKICILTKTIMAEDELQKKLQLLGYEVFVSSHLLEMLMAGEGKVLFQIFKTIIFSETVSDYEIERVVEQLANEPVRMFRMDSTKESSGDEGLSHNTPFYLRNDTSLNDLREKLSYVFESMPVEYQEEPAPSTNYLDSNFLNFIHSLSVNEKNLFDILYAANGQYIKRAELSEKLWQKEASNSSLAQLSQLLFRIRKKMTNHHLDGESLRSHWREGYALSQDFYDEEDLPN